MSRAFALLAIAIFACTPPAEEEPLGLELADEVAAAPEPAPAPRVASAFLEAKEEEIESLHLRLGEMQERIEVLEEERSAWRQEAARQEAGLARCVEELNTVTGQRRAASPRRHSAGSRSSESRSVYGEVYSIRDATVYMSGDEAVVTGRVANSRTDQQTVAAQIHVTLYRDGREIDNDVVDLDVPAEGIHTWETSFFIGSVPGPLSVRAEIVQ